MSKDDFAVYRIAGSLTTLIIHVTQLRDMSETAKVVLPQHPELEHLNNMGPRFVTVWNIILQILYATFSIYCDVWTLINDQAISEAVKRIRYNIFAGLVFPIGMGIPLTFWPIYFYDRQLVFPPSADLMVTPIQNSIAHGGIFLYALWELVFLPRDSIKNNLEAFKLTCIFCLTYTLTCFYTKYVDLGVWAYDLLTVTEGTYLFFFAFSGPIATAVLGYVCQWYIKDAVWKHRDSKKTE